MTLMTYMGISTSHKSSQMHIFAHFIEENEQIPLDLYYAIMVLKAAIGPIKAFSSRKKILMSAYKIIFKP